MQECPHCLGAKTVMVPKETRGFEYRKCDICNGSGIVTLVLYQDFINSQKPFEDENDESIK